jgi:hypothetical protein
MSTGTPGTPKTAELRAVKPDDQMVLICPFCQHKNPLLALRIMSGGSETCEGCGSRIEMKFFYSKPAVKMVGRVQGTNEDGEIESAEVHNVRLCHLSASSLLVVPKSFRKMVRVTASWRQD